MAKFYEIALELPAFQVYLSVQKEINSGASCSTVQVGLVE
jgi:hypothetical protein